VNFGPWSPTIQPEERGKQFRSLASIAHVILGPHHPLIGELRRAETDAIAFVKAQELVEKLPALTRRRMLLAFSAVTFGRQEAAP
jgi:hypothetical protein